MIPGYTELHFAIRHQTKLTADEAVYVDGPYFRYEKFKNAPTLPEFSSVYAGLGMFDPNDTNLFRSIPRTRTVLLLLLISSSFRWFDEEAESLTNARFPPEDEGSVTGRAADTGSDMEKCLEVERGKSVEGSVPVTSIFDF